MKHNILSHHSILFNISSALHHEKLSVDWLKIMLVKIMAVFHTRNKARHILFLPSVPDSAAG